MSIISVGKRFGDMDIRLGIPPSKPQFDVNYDDVKSIKIVKPTIKKYLYAYCQTGFLRINADEAAIAIYLPVQRFKKASDAVVYSDSRKFL